MKLSFGNERGEEGEPSPGVGGGGMKRWEGEEEGGSEESFRINQPVVMLI